jgi:hypothetical protein
MKKPEIKINFLYYETPFDINKNFCFKFLKRKYNVIISDKPDYVFFSVYKENNKFLDKDGTPKTNKNSKNKKINFIKKIILGLMKFNKVKGFIWFLREKNIIKPYAKILDVKGDFVKIFYTYESIRPDMTKCDWAFALRHESELKHPKYMRVPPYIVFGYNFDLIKKEKSIEKIKKEKTKFCNFIYSNHVPFRNKFFKKLNKYKHIDSPGKCMNNMLPIGIHKNVNKSRISKDWEKEKIDFIKPYKFTIAFENEIRSGYNTDRIIHSYLANSIPIYFGDKMIDKDFNANVFINCHNFKNFEEAIKKIIEVDKNDEIYLKMLKQPLFAHKNSFTNATKRIEKRFEEILKSNPQITTIFKKDF